MVVESSYYRAFIVAQMLSAVWRLGQKGLSYNSMACHVQVLR